MSKGNVEIKVENDVGIITFFHPQSNSLPGDVLSALTKTITEAGQQDDIKIIIIQSEGDRAFCAGASFDELTSISSVEEGRKFFMGFANVINACRKSHKLIIGRAQGKTVGGGVRPRFSSRLLSGC